MQLEPIERVGPMNQNRLDDWFDRAMQDETVRPYLTTGVHTPRLTIPEDDYDGAVLMNRTNTGVLKIYTDEESRTMKLGIWVLQPKMGPSRGVTALSLMKGAVVIANQNPLIDYFGTRVMSTNDHGTNFSTRLLEVWGSEHGAVWDSVNGHWADWDHYRCSVDRVAHRLESWEMALDNRVS